MISKRTNIIFDKELWEKLTGLAKEKKTSVAKLVRQALEETYFSDKVEKERSEAIDRIFKIRKFIGKVDYKELINAGRKY